MKKNGIVVVVEKVTSAKINKPVKPVYNLFAEPKIEHDIILL